MNVSKMIVHARTSRIKTGKNLRSDIKQLKNMLDRNSATKPSKFAKKKTLKDKEWVKFTDFSYPSTVRSTMTSKRAPKKFNKYDKKVKPTAHKQFRNQSLAVIPIHKPFFKKLSPIE